ncbi:TonB-dependent receptor [Pedobacter sp. HMF7647]|uniref:TonB-dependent receptor n=2 Tax=Hufsiella arboris TaxID=2695275 RepID=A0A7K1Y682_9SPHI|nr:TonB-dependent receptor [Hufsiella arboris]MXV49619.1 TonB-dependent receptor [Hufsiella arboris]
MLLPFLALAQFSVTGKISAKLTKQPLAGASISLSNIGRTQTGPDGSFHFENIKEGRYQLQVSYLGYKTNTQTIELTRNTELDLSLEPASLITDEVIVSATRAGKNSATTYTNLDKATIEKYNQGQDLPYILNQTPSVVVSSDAGAGVGYTGIRIRGSDPTRTNVTVNGIPFNDAESQGSFFVDVPDFASSIDNIQVQRGVGTSTNGAGAFGASINIQTNTRHDSAYAELNNTYGSYDTWKNTVNVGTGLINGKFTVDGRLSRIKSEGYIDRASSDLKSYFLSGAWYGKNDLLRANVFSGYEKTYQAWNGVPETLLQTDRTYNGFTYNDQTDNYWQDHYQLLYSHTFSTKFFANAAIHYTYGRGYYEEYKDDQNFADYGLLPAVVNGETIDATNLIRRRWLDNDFYGATYSFNYNPSKNLNFTLGGAWNEYDGKHYGQVIWSQYPSPTNEGNENSNADHYYDGHGYKKDFNTYLKASYTFGAATIFGDLQYRNLNYIINGLDKNRNPLDQRHNLNFFNPKVGFSYQLNDANNVYASYAVAHKEPNRDDYINNNTAETNPKPEKLQDIEVGYRHNQSNFNAGVNAYGMFYKDQLILTGRINDVGESIRQNVPSSYRIGLEADLRWKPFRNFTWAATASLSKNKIKTFTEFIPNYDDGSQTENIYKDPDIAYSPNFIASSELTYQLLKHADLSFISKYVGDQYLDNTENEARKLQSFFVNDCRLRYNLGVKGIKNIGLSLLVNNVFGELYESNGYSFSYIYAGAQATENYYFPQATRNFLLSLNLKF